MIRTFKTCQTSLLSWEKKWNRNILGFTLTTRQSRLLLSGRCSISSLVSVIAFSDTCWGSSKHFERLNKLMVNPGSVLDSALEFLEMTVQRRIIQKWKTFIVLFLTISVFSWRRLHNWPLQEMLPAHSSNLLQILRRQLHYDHNY